MYLPEQPRPMVLPTFQRPIILGSWFFCCKGGKLGTMIEYRNVGPLRNQETKGIGDRKKMRVKLLGFVGPGQPPKDDKKKSSVTPQKYASHVNTNVPLALKLSLPPQNTSFKSAE